MKKFVFAAVGVFALVGFVVADEFNVTVTKVEGNTVFYKKAGGGGGKKGGGAGAMEEKADVTSDVKVLKGEVVAPDAPPAKKGAGKKGGAGGKGAGGFAKSDVKAGDPIEKGLKNDLFTKIEGAGVQARIITNADNKITEIRAVTPK